MTADDCEFGAILVARKQTVRSVKQFLAGKLVQLRFLSAVIDCACLPYLASKRSSSRRLAQIPPWSQAIFRLHLMFPFRRISRGYRYLFLIKSSAFLPFRWLNKEVHLPRMQIHRQSGMIERFQHRINCFFYERSRGNGWCQGSTHRLANWFERRLPDSFALITPPTSITCWDQWPLGIESNVSTLRVREFWDRVWSDKSQLVEFPC
jgi:hypothetical protein